ncbi:L,D-transpeptidase family protein [Bosea massiliensis]|uniref:L,D-transpeptidase family protein n=1 Tax=Bosea massiliensis TaxID=151419 RepID=A0ABW0P3Z7_9HYPH
MQFPTLRPFVRLAAALALGAFVLSGCVVGEGDTRHLQPLPAKLVAQIHAKGMSEADPIFVRIYKMESELEVWKRDRSGRYALLKTYPMCRWSGQLGPKKREGDRQAPEGFYTVTADLMNPRSQFYLSFNLGYPNPLERSQGYSGSALMVHGACTSAGCFAMTDEGVSEIYGLAREAFAGGQAGFQVQALPFRMTPENMVRYRSNAHIAFWRNLKEGADHFDATRQPPKLAACGRRYVFNVKGDTSSFDPAGLRGRTGNPGPRGGAPRPR